MYQLPSVNVIFICCRNFNNSSNNNNEKEDLEMEQGRGQEREGGKKRIEICSVHVLPKLNVNIPKMNETSCNPQIY